MRVGLPITYVRGVDYGYHEYGVVRLGAEHKEKFVPHGTVGSFEQACREAARIADKK